MGRSRRLLERIVALADGRDRDGWGQLMAPDCEFVVPGAPPVRGREVIEGFGRAWDAAFSGGRHTVLDMVESGDLAVAELRWTGTHTGTLVTPQGEVPATGRSVVLDHVLAIRTGTDGEMAESVHTYFDQLGFMQQLGLVPATA